ncbi:uncharacterized protein LOC113373514 [Ctenocephalides felis]|uniref:uncharacterized protein LOC113373514 n=1 Tax=Ctenocephalides felis TaxID=7515 RepID=UPI000E6E4674|nr:uncharacterized protein LOC113373514 [Ctenocephalides felis]
MKHDKNDIAFDIGDYNFTEYFRNLDSRKTDLKIVTHTANNEVTNLQNLDSVSKKNVLRRKGNTRFLDLFSIIKFENKPCSLEYDLLETTDGTCYHKTECDRLGGLAVGSCAKGFGVCCIFSLKCGDMSLQNVSYFESPGFPKPTSSKLACAITVVALPGVRQFRLDFLSFEMQPPTNGDCIEDQLLISGQMGNKLPPMCGINTGQHMYLDVSQSNFLMVSALTNSDRLRQYRIKITQLTPEQNVPDGCLQHYDDLDGRIESFNYADSSRILDARRPGYFNNMNYAICITRKPGRCAVTYFNADFFQISNVGLDGEPIIPPEQAGVEVFNCPDDFIIINGVRLCGERLNDASLIEDFTIDAPVVAMPTKRDSKLKLYSRSTTSSENIMFV